MSSRTAANSASLLSPYKSCSSLHFWNDAPISLWFSPILCFYIAFLHQSSYYFSLMWAMMGQFSALLPLHHCSQYKHELEHIWPSASTHFAREVGCQQRMHENETLLWHSPLLWLVVLIWERVTLKCASLNVNGLSNPVKRGKVPAKMRKDKVQIIFLQETHMSKNKHEKFKKFGYLNSFFSSCENSRKRGVATLISNSLNF